MTDAYMPTPHLRQLILSANPFVAKLQQLYESPLVGEDSQWRDVPFVSETRDNAMEAHCAPSSA